MYFQASSFIQITCNLNKITEWKRLNGSNFSTIKVVSFLWKHRSTLEVDLVSRLACFFLGGFIFLFTSNNFLLALGRSNVFNADMNTLFNNASIDKLVDTNTDRRLCNVEHNSSSSVVKLVWHTLVNRRIGKDIDVVTHLDLHEVLREVNRSMLPKLLGKHVARTRPDTI